MYRNSFRFVPWGATGQSVPIATFTPASTARRKASNSGRPRAASFSRTASGTFGSFAIASVVSPAVSVGTSHAVLEHELDAFVVEVGAVVDRSNAGANRPFDALRPVRV